MAEYEIERERIIERPTVHRTIVEERRGGWGVGFNPLSGVIMAVVAILLLLLILGVLV